MHRRRIFFVAALAAVLAMAIAPNLWADRDGGGNGAGGGAFGGGGPAGGGDGGDGGRSGGDSGGDNGGAPGSGGGSDRGDKDKGGGSGEAGDCCDDDAQEGNDSDARDDYAGAVFDGVLDDANRDASE